MNRKEKQLASEVRRNEAVEGLVLVSPLEALEWLEDQMRKEPQKKTFWLQVKEKLLWTPNFKTRLMKDQMERNKV